MASPQRTLITPETVQEGLKITGKAFEVASNFFDIFRKQQTCLIEWTSPNYMKVTVAWGFFELQKGEHRIFEIKGKPAFVKAVSRTLQSNGPTKVLTH